MVSRRKPPKRSKRQSQKRQRARKPDESVSELTAADHAKAHAFRQLAEKAKEAETKQEANSSLQALARLPARAREALEGVRKMIRAATQRKRKRPARPKH